MGAEGRKFKSCHPDHPFAVYSGDIGNRLFRRHRGHFSTERILGALHPAAFLIEEAQVAVHEDHQPDLLAGLFGVKRAEWLDRTLPGSRGVRRVE